MRKVKDTSRKEKVVLDWDSYLTLIDVLSIIIPKKNYERIIGISRGGLIPATILAHKLGIKNVISLDKRGIKLVWSLGLKRKETLVVDDLVDSGETLEGCLYNTAVIFKKPWSKVKPTYCVMETKKWIVFPYEI